MKVRRRIKKSSESVEKVKSGPNTRKVVRDLLDVMNQNNLTNVNVSKSTLEAMLAGEVEVKQEGSKVKFAVGTGEPKHTLE